MDRIEHTGRIPRASRSHTFYTAAGTSGMNGPERPIAPTAQDVTADDLQPQPYTDDEMRGSY